MLRIVSHIEILLQTHDCVIIPGFGGFVLRELPAVYDAEEHQFIPATKDIGFNATLQHNDGVLAESYMKLYEVDYQQAWTMLQQDILAFRHDLQEKLVLVLGKTGRLVLEEEGQIRFIVNDLEYFCPDSYGLTSFHLPTLKSLQHEEVERLAALEKDRDTLYIPISRRFLKGVTAAAAAVALFLVVSTPVKDISQSTYSASVIPVDMFSAPAVIEPVIEEEEAPVLLEIVAEPVVEKEVRVAPAPNRKMFHVVIGSFVTHKQADEFIEKVNRTVCPGLDRIVRDERIRVYADKFDNRDEAETFLENIRQYAAYKDAWLFISR